jgi:uncharacterized protein YbjQ (UPF0145 family)
VLIVTTNDIPGWEIQRVFSQIGAGFKSMFGVIAEAHIRGGNAIIGMRFDPTELGDVWTEICAYGTAVQALPVTDAANYTASRPAQPQPYGA